LERSADGEALSSLATGRGRGVALPVSDNRYVHLPTEKLRAILRVVAELYEGKGALPGPLKFPGVKSDALGRLDGALADASLLEDPEGDTVSRGIRWENRTRLAIHDEPEVEVAPPKGLHATLRPYQVEGLTWLQRMRARGTGGVLADDMGLGKTLQTIAHLTVEKEAGRLLTAALIVAPTSLVNNWQREIAKFSPGLRVRAHHGADRHKHIEGLWDHDVVVTSYPCVCRDEDLFQTQQFHMLILDEAQTIKNDKSQAHRVMRGLTATHRLCLTGTPVENHLGELWALSDFLNPGLLGDELHFARFFRIPIEKQKNNERLQTLRELLSPYIIRRTKAEVAKELPPKTELMRPIEAGLGQRELYESIRVAAHEEVRKIIKKKGLAAATIPILGALTKLRQVCCDPRLAGISVDAKATTTPLSSAKLEFFTNLLVDKLGTGQRILVFSQFTSMLKLIAERLDELAITFTALTGSTVDRPKAVDRFQNREVDVFLISLRAGGTGLTLTTADTVIHYDPWWNPAIQAQATDRAYRIGQTKPVFVHHLYIAGSVEERMLRLQARKRKVADAILGAGDAQGALTEEDVDILFAPLSA
jgi:SNF2 family DNA or RNA helicase